MGEGVQGYVLMQKSNDLANMGYKTLQGDITSVKSFEGLTVVTAIHKTDGQSFGTRAVHVYEDKPHYLRTGKDGTGSHIS